MNFEEYLKEELSYYDQHPEEDDTLEAHSNASLSFEMDWSASS
tara:strand:+ start:408 stop:536 length:129 start_codon:yes stop_codon:yes gene_type:complete